MSTKSSILLTKEGEHWYEETAEPYEDEHGNFVGWAIILEMEKDNVEVIEDSQFNLSIRIKPGSEIYNAIKSLKK